VGRGTDEDIAKSGVAGCEHKTAIVDRCNSALLRVVLNQLMATCMGDMACGQHGEIALRVPNVAQASAVATSIIHVTIYTKAPVPCSKVRARRNLTSLYTDTKAESPKLGISVLNALAKVKITKNAM
jgi:hypothetical protein